MNINQSLLLAKQYCKNNNLAQAKELYLEILKTFPASKVAKKELKKLNTKIAKEVTYTLSKDQQNNLMKLYGEGDYEKTLEESIRLSKIFEENAFVYNMMGIALLNLGKYEDAIYSYKQVLKIKPAYADAYYNIGVALFGLNKYEEAIVSYQEALKIKPDYVDAYNNLGIIFMHMGRDDEAIEAYQQALKIKPNYANAYYNIGITLFKTGKNEEAIMFYQEALKVQPNYVEAYNNLASALLKIGKNKEAIEACRKAVKIKPNHSEAYSNMGTALISIGENDEAIEACKRALSIQPTLREATATLVTIFIQSVNGEDIEELSRTQDTYLMKVLVIIHAFIHKSFLRCESLIFELRKKLEIDLDYWLSKDKDKKFITAYLEFIDGLNSNMLVQEQSLKHDMCQDTIYHIGESHSLTFAHQVVSLGKRSYTVKPLIIFGTKAWHLGNKNENQYKTYFQNYIESLEENAHIILSFGEIDCRVDEGIIKYHLKTKCKLEDIVSQTVQNYIAYTELILKKRQIKRVYMGIPAPVIKVDNDLSAIRVEIVRLFNEELMKTAKERELSFVDVYKLTVNKDGTSNLQYMCDDFHLKSSTFNEFNLEFK